MKPYYIRVHEQAERSGRKKLILSIYLFHQVTPDYILDSAIQEGTQDSDFYNEVHVIGFGEFVEPVKDSFLSGTIADRLKGRTAQLDQSIFFITLDESSGCYLVKGTGLINEAHCQEICDFQRRTALFALFKEQDGLKESKLGYHYSKPSKHHSEKFLRASNVIEHYAATPIIVFWLIGKVWDVEEIEHIIVDTSGISSVGFALAHELSRRKINQKKVYPIVSSHKSYGGLEKLQILRPNQSILLISASTSGGLKNKLVEKGAIERNVLTLFFLGEAIDSAGNVLCDLAEDDNGFGFKAFKQYPESDCALCQKGSYPITLDGDQFLPEPPEVDTISLKFEDLSPDEREQLDQLAGIELFCVHRNVDDKVTEISFNVEKLFQEKINNVHKPTVHALEEFQKRWVRELARAVTINLRHIVYASYPYSKDLARNADTTIKSYRDDSHEIIDSKSLLNVSSSDDSSALVLTACLDNPKELNGISLSLRDKQPQGNVFYLAPIFKADRGEDRKRIRSNLTYGENKADTFSLISIININLPNSPKQDSWSAELNFLYEFKAWLDQNEIDLPDYIQTRIEILENAPSTGLVNKLFWPGIDSSELEIRSDFTFIKTHGNKRQISQADVFVVVSALLRSLRNRGGVDKPALVYGPYKRAVISPDCFKRFSDGVIQSAILRAAREQELSYTNCAESVSAQMRDVITNLLNGPENSAQAVPEFLLAIALNKLNLHPEHEMEVFEAVQGNDRVNIVSKLLARYLAALSNFSK